MSTQQDHSDPPDAGASSPEAAETDAVARARQVLRSTTPSAGIATILELDTGSETLASTRRQIVGGVEELTGLRLGELHALIAVADGADHHRTVARRTGQTDAAAAATVDGLVGKGALARHHHPAEPNADAPPTLVHLTARGEALLGQSEAIRVRLLDTIADTLGGTELEDVRAVADTLTQGIAGSLGPRQIGGTPAAS